MIFSTCADFTGSVSIADCHPSPDCSGNPFLKKKIAAESGKKLLISEELQVNGISYPTSMTERGNLT